MYKQKRICIPIRGRAPSIINDLSNAMKFTQSVSICACEFINFKPNLILRFMCSHIMLAQVRLVLDRRQFGECGWKTIWLIVIAGVSAIVILIAIVIIIVVRARAAESCVSTCELRWTWAFAQRCKYFPRILLPMRACALGGKISSFLASFEQVSFKRKIMISSFRC